MSCLSTSLVSSNTFLVPSSSLGSSLKSVDQCLGCLPANLSISTSRAGRRQLSTSRRALTVQASYSDEGRPSSMFVGGFILGGLLVGSLGCICAPQVSRALAGADKQDLMRKLPKFIYDEEKALERTRKILAEKIEQLNSAIDDVSAQLRSEDTLDDPDNVAVNSDEIESLV